MVDEPRIPTDLMPLPTMPYDERPLSMPLDVDECRTAIWRCRGNVTKAANLLKIAPSRLRKFTQKSPFLLSEIAEAQEQLADIAEDVVYDALNDDTDKGRQDAMARFVLQTIGARRGYKPGTGGTVNIKTSAPMTIMWGDGTSLSGPQTIDGEVVNADER